jgi:hypothetical protein
MKTITIARNWVACAVALVNAAACVAYADQQIAPEEGALRTAIAEGGVISFVRGGGLNVRNPLMIEGDVTIDAGGAAVVVSGASASRVFHVLPGASLTLTNVTVANGRAAFGAGVFNEGNLTLVDCIFTDNTALGADAPGNTGDSGEGAVGGAVYNTGSLTMSGTAFNGNSAVAGAGGSGAKGANGHASASPGGIGGNGGQASGGAVFSSGTLTATNCTFTANKAEGGDGGAGGAGGDDLSSFGGRGASGADAGSGGSASGGAMSLIGPSTLVDVRCVDNQSTGGKGGVAGTGGTDVITENSGDSGRAGIGGCASGGAVFIDASSVQMSLFTLSGNRVQAGSGGLAVTAPAALVIGSNGNGGIGGEATGGAIHVNGGSLILEQSTVARNTIEGGQGTAGANSFDAPWGRFLPSSGGIGGHGGRALGSIYNAGELLILGSTIHSNALRGGNGGAGGNGGSARTVRGSAGGHAGDGGAAAGGGVCNRGVASLINCTIVDNECQGGIGANGGVSGQARFFNETVTGGNGGVGGLAGGAAVYSDNGGQTTVEFVTLANNAVYSGRGGKGGKGSTSGGTQSPDGSDAPDGRAEGANLFTFSGGALTVRSSISVVSGTGPGRATQGSGSITDAGSNLCSDDSCGFTDASSLNDTDPLLQPLIDNGGPTSTMALDQGSPAIDSAHSSGAPSTDQRGYMRPAVGGYDIGAFEVDASPSPGPGPVDGYLVSGRVTEGGEGLSGVKVKLGRQVAYTDVNGDYQFVVKKKGRYAVRPVAPRTRFAPLVQRVKVREDVVFVPDFVVKRRR